jgi:hypothetical protein
LDVHRGCNSLQAVAISRDQLGTGRRNVKGMIDYRMEVGPPLLAGLAFPQKSTTVMAFRWKPVFISDM